MARHAQESTERQHARQLQCSGCEDRSIAAAAPADHMACNVVQQELDESDDRASNAARGEQEHAQRVGGNAADAIDAEQQHDSTTQPQKRPTAAIGCPPENCESNG